MIQTFCKIIVLPHFANVQLKLCKWLVLHDGAVLGPSIVAVIREANTMQDKRLVDVGKVDWQFAIDDCALRLVRCPNFVLRSCDILIERSRHKTKPLSKYAGSLGLNRKGQFWAGSSPAGMHQVCCSTCAETLVS